MASDIVPIQLSLTEGDLVTLWAPKWREDGEEWEAFLGDDDALFAFPNVAQLAAFDVSLGPGEPARLLRVDGEPPGAPRWSLHDLPAIPGYAAALVVEGAEGAALRLACWDWPPAGLP